MPSVINVGGSLTGAIFITIAAWGIRSFRAAQHKRREREEAQALKTTRVGRFFAPLSPAAVRMLVRSWPCAWLGCGLAHSNQRLGMHVTLAARHKWPQLFARHSSTVK